MLLQVEIKPMKELNLGHVGALKVHINDVVSPQPHCICIISSSNQKENMFTLILVITVIRIILSFVFITIEIRAFYIL